MAVQVGDAVTVNTDEIDEATKAYLHGRLSLEEYERLLDLYVPSPEALLQTLNENRGFVARLVKSLRKSRTT
jgi:hypothetical protein